MSELIEQTQWIPTMWLENRDGVTFQLWIQGSGLTEWRPIPTVNEPPPPRRPAVAGYLSEDDEDN